MPLDSTRFMDVRDTATFKALPLTNANVAKAASPLQPKKSPPPFPGVARSAPGGVGDGVPPVAALVPSTSSLPGCNHSSGYATADVDDVPVGYTPFCQPGGSPMAEPDADDPISKVIGVAERKAGETIKAFIAGLPGDVVYNWAKAHPGSHRAAVAIPPADNITSVTEGDETDPYAAGQGAAYWDDKWQPQCGWSAGWWDAAWATHATQSAPGGAGDGSSSGGDGGDDASQSGGGGGGSDPGLSSMSSTTVSAAAAVPAVPEELHPLQQMAAAAATTMSAAAVAAMATAQRWSEQDDDSSNDAAIAAAIQKEEGDLLERRRLASQAAVIEPARPAVAAAFIEPPRAAGESARPVVTGENWVMPISGTKVTKVDGLWYD